MAQSLGSRVTMRGTVGAEAQMRGERGFMATGACHVPHLSVVWLGPNVKPLGPTSTAY